MSLKTIMISISRRFLCFDGFDPKLHHENSENSHVICPMEKPSRGGQAEDGASPVLPKVRSKLLRLHLRRLGSAAASTFAILG